MGKHRWKGELAKPIHPKVIRPRGLRVTKETAQVANEEMEDLYRQAIEEQYLVKLELLMDHYKITDKTDFRSLAVALAKELGIPGFKVDRKLRSDTNDPAKIWLIVRDTKEGRPPKWTVKQLDDLLGTVEELKKKHSISDHEALLRLPRHLRSECSLKTLKNQLAEARHLNRLSGAETRRLRKLITPRRNPGN